MSEAEQLISLAESSEEKRKREQRERKQRQRAKEKIEAEELNPESVQKLWERNSKDLIAKNPKMHAELVARHEYVAELQAEVEEISGGVRANLRAETRTLETKDSTEIFPMPDLCWRDCFADFNDRGLLNYCAIEGARDREGKSMFRPYEGQKLDASATSFYRLYGFRTCLTIDTLQSVTDSLCLYFLRTGDASLDMKVVRQAIAYRKENGGWPQHDKEFKTLLAKRTKKSPLTFEETIAQTLSDLESLGEREL
jgi:hypothetical protein